MMIFPVEPILTTPLVDLVRVLDTNHISHISLLNTDCDGCELDLLRHVLKNPGHVTIDAAVVRANRSAGTIQKLLEGKGFSLHSHAGDMIFINNGLAVETRPRR